LEQKSAKDNWTSYSKQKSSTKIVNAFLMVTLYKYNLDYI